MYCTGSFKNWVQLDDDPVDSWATWTMTNVMLGTSNLSFISRFDWNKYDDEIWYRIRERADYKLLDSLYDTKPPVVKNEWVVAPYIYDLKFNKDDGAWPYDDLGYEPSWYIKAESILMEDLEDNGCFYLFDFAHATYSDEENLMDYIGPLRKYDELLDMDVSETQGDDIDAWAAYDALIGSWAVTLNTRDNYNSYVPSKNNNVGTPTSSVSIVLGTYVPMFPVTPRTKTIIADIGDGNQEYVTPIRVKIGDPEECWDFIKVDIPLTNSGVSCQFVLQELMSNTWVDLDQDDEPTSITVPESMTGQGCFWVQRTNFYSRTYYRLAYKNSNTQKTGKYYYYNLPAGKMLHIQEAVGKNVKVNDESVTLPYDGVFDDNEVVVVECTNLAYMWYRYAPDYGTVTDNPWSITLNADYDILPY